MMPYLQTIVRECHDTGLPIMRALWLHYPEDATAVARGDQYLWGREIIVAPVTEKGATTRSLYLPRGQWYDFWTENIAEGGREISRDVDLATIPLYVRSGSILPLGPIKQHTGEQVDGPLTLVIYPGSDGSFTLYEDDGRTFDYRRGESMRIRINWNERSRRLTLRLAEGSRMLPPLKRKIEVRIVPEKTTRSIVFEGQPIEIRMKDKG